MSKYEEKARLRFEKNYIPEPNSGCWLWIGYSHHQGYVLDAVSKGRFKMPPIQWGHK